MYENCSRMQVSLRMLKHILRILILLMIPVVLPSQTQPDSTAIVLFGGDLNFAYRFEQSVGERVNKIFSQWKKIGTYDLMMVNLENAVTRSMDSVKKEFVFKMKPEYLSLLGKAEIVLVNCANNHIADFGEVGILETIRLLDSAGVRHIGIGGNLAESRKPVVLTIHGIRIGFLGYGGTHAYLASRTQAGTTPRNKSIILYDIAKLKTRVDYVVINLHWGEESALKPDSSQIALAHALIDGGADLIIGHHPHILQGVEHYHGKVIAYSLGNFIFGGNAKCANSETAVLKAQFSGKSMDVKLIPIQIRNWCPEPADSVAALRVRQLIRERSRIFGDTLSLDSLMKKK